MAYVESMLPAVVNTVTGPDHVSYAAKRHSARNARRAASSKWLALSARTVADAWRPAPSAFRAAAPCAPMNKLFKAHSAEAQPARMRRVLSEGRTRPLTLEDVMGEPLPAHVCTASDTMLGEVQSV